MDPLLPVLIFLSIGLGAILLILYFAVPYENHVPDQIGKQYPAMSKAHKNFEGRYIVGPEIF